MDRSLWVLIGLQARGRLRRWGRNLRTVKGALLVVIGALFFAPMLISFLFMPRVMIEAQVAAIRQHGALGLLVYCLLNVLLSSGERGVVYSPAEVNFLFCGPYRPRHLLLYKIAGDLGAGLLMSLLFTAAFTMHTFSPVAAFAGIFLTLELLALFTMAVSLLAGTIGAAAFDRRRQVMLVATLGLASAALFQVGRHVAGLDPAQFVVRLEGSPFVRPFLLPFEPFVRVYTARRTWPDLVGWSALATVIDLAMLGTVLALNAGHLEASAKASARLYERIKRARRGTVWVQTPKARFRVPALPWWGGMGPNLWRQLVTVTRDPVRVLALFLFYLMPVGMMFVVTGHGSQAVGRGIPALVIMVSMTIFTPTMIGFDFRPDLHRMDLLKTLPIPAFPLVLGQLAAPTLILTLGQGLALGTIEAFAPLDPLVFACVLVLAPSLNLLLVALENLSVLWFPTRWIGGNTVDFQTMGRQMVLMMVKLACTLLVVAVASGLGAAGYYLFHESGTAAVAVAWLTVSGFAIGMVPLLSQAFRQFDVARDKLD